MDQMAGARGRGCIAEGVGMSVRHAEGACGTAAGPILSSEDRSAPRPPDSISHQGRTHFSTAAVSVPVFKLRMYIIPQGHGEDFPRGAVAGLFYGTNFCTCSCLRDAPWPRSEPAILSHFP